MSVCILKNRFDEQAALYCSTSDFAFGPVFSHSQELGKSASERAERPGLVADGRYFTTTGLKTMDREKFVAYALGAMGIGLWLSDAFVANAKPMGPSFADKVAEACLPAQAERKTIEWNVDENGEKAVTVTTQQFIGTRKGTAQYEIIGVARLP